MRAAGMGAMIPTVWPKICLSPKPVARSPSLRAFDIIIVWLRNIRAIVKGSKAMEMRIHVQSLADAMRALMMIWISIPTPITFFRL